MVIQNSRGSLFRASVPALDMITRAGHFKMFLKIHSLSLCENSFYVVGIGGLPQIPPARPSKAGGFSIFAWFSLVKEWIAGVAKTRILATVAKLK